MVCGDSGGGFGFVEEVKTGDVFWEFHHAVCHHLHVVSHPISSLFSLSFFCLSRCFSLFSLFSLLLFCRTRGRTVFPRVGLRFMMWARYTDYVISRRAHQDLKHWDEDVPLWRAWVEVEGNVDWENEEMRELCFVNCSLECFCVFSRVLHSFPHPLIFLLQMGSKR